MENLIMSLKHPNVLAHRPALCGRSPMGPAGFESEPVRGCLVLEIVEQNMPRNSGRDYHGILNRPVKQSVEIKTLLKRG